MTEYQLATALIAVMTAATSRASSRLNGSYFTPISVFWGAWLFLFVAGALVISEGLLPDPTESTYYYFWRMSIGAVIGSIGGVVIARNARPADRRRWADLSSRAEATFNVAYPVFVVGMATIGSVHFIQQWQAVDFDFMRLYELRELVLENEWSVVGRIANYFAQFGFFLAVVKGLLDARSGRIAVRTVVIMTFANAPQGLAFGGRIWVLGTTIAYLLSYFLARSAPGTPRPPMSVIATKLAIPLFIGLVLFTLLGQLRSRDFESNRHKAENAQWDAKTNLMFATWFSSSIIAIGPQTEFTAKLPRGWGQATFEYPTRKLQQMGLVEPLVERWLDWLRHDLRFQPIVGFTWCAPPTFIPYLVLDFGETGLPIATALVLVFLQVVCLRFAGGGIFRHTVALLAIWAALNTIQTLTLFSTQNVVVAILAWAVEFFVGRSQGAIATAVPSPPGGNRVIPFVSRRRAGQGPT